MRPEVVHAVEALNEYETLTNAGFDEVVERFGVQPDDEELILALMEQGWHYLVYGATWNEDLHYLRIPPDRTVWRILRHPEV